MFGGTPGAIWYLLTIHHALVTSMKEKTPQGTKVSHLSRIWSYFSYFLSSKIQLNVSLYEHFTFSLTVSNWVIICSGLYEFGLLLDLLPKDPLVHYDEH